MTKCALSVLLLLATANSLLAQNQKDKIIEDFENFQKIPESVIYLHLNKSILLEGEDLGFTAYVYDKKKQKPFEEVKNLYCQLLDAEGTVVKEQLLLVERGIANSTFTLDLITPPGKYSIRAFTNWMKNFSESHYFEAPILILSSNGEFSNKNAVDDKLSIQVLPEGGHLVKDVPTTVAIKVDDRLLPETKFAVLYVNGISGDKIALDSQGIGRFSIIPQEGDSYEITLDKNLAIPLPKIERSGIVLSVNLVKGKVFIELRTNQETLNIFKDQELALLVNGTSKLEVYNVVLKGLKELIPISLIDFSTGVNQISLISSDNKVIAKRLFFNYGGFEVKKSTSVTISRTLDTLMAQIKFNDLKNARVSISVHPVSTIAVDKSLSIAAALKLYPYLYDTVKNPLYYLTDVNERKKHEMDNLMLCLGWEMYDWSFIFDQNKVFKNDFETGITVDATVNSSKSRNFFVHPSRNTKSASINLVENQDTFLLEQLLPTTGEMLRISELGKNGTAGKTGIYLRFFPNRFPSFSSHRKIKYLSPSFEIEKVQSERLLPKAVALDTIMLTAKAKDKREQKIRRMARGRVDIFTDKDRASKFDVLQYIRQNGFTTSNIGGEVRISAMTALVDMNEPVAIILDGVLFRDATILLGFDMSIIDYVEFDTTGVTRLQGTGQGGIISIKTDPTLNPFSTNTSSFSSYDIPLTFTIPTKFYRPAYYTYDDDFFNGFGVIDWQGDVEIKDGNGTFSMPYLGINKLLFHIQGWANDGTLIDEYREVEVIGSAVKY